MSDQSGPLGMLGGAFDPVHFGHLRCAIEVREQLGLAEVLLVPSGNPPHRNPHHASAEARADMLRAAIADMQGFRLDIRELQRSGPSWSVVTLEELRSEYPQRSLCMIVGLDAFLSLPNWHRWEEILELAHVVVATRPGPELPKTGTIAGLLDARRSDDVGLLNRETAGAIFVNEITQLDIASSTIRNLLAAGRNPRYLLPDSVLQLINSSSCYQEEVTTE